MGLLSDFLGAPGSDQSNMLGLFAQGLARRDGVGGLLAANQFAATAPQRAEQAQQRELERQLLLARVAETQAQADERKQKTQRELQAAEAARRKRDALPGLFGGQTLGGELTAPQIDGVPMVSQGAGLTPQRQVGAGQFNVRAAIDAGYTPEEISAYAGLQNIGRPKATRQMEVDDGKGGKRIALVDDFGQEVAGFAGYTPPVQVNRGDRVDFVKPAPGVSLGINMSPEGRDASARGWATVNQGAQRLALDAANGAAGKAPAGYRFTPNGQLEFIPGGPADPARNGEKVPSEGERKAATLLQRLEGSSAQLAAALKTAPGAAKPELKAEALRKIPWIGGDTLANVGTSEPRQQVESAQLDMLDAALTLGTGAAYTREQLEGYRKSYFPQIGDDPKAVADKQARLKNVIDAARIAAGRAAGQVPLPAPVSTGGGAGQPVQWRYVDGKMVKVQ